ncbi:MAG: hypothetical protein JST94_09250 [Bacteroidetes bacterium]|nr:hypothetical protein [Bacteroidota bacterium]MBS1591319.1 hypothetical protein [Bacteroidota bacterium]MBS1640745.1 hypothetical protein [Bacteroidota bacterium]MBS1642381.1 hypothetical protein [Bacteroidota bacterium]MBS1671618.1 hypothetical protein [Bacteroidota bacterium]
MNTNKFFIFSVLSFVFSLVAFQASAQMQNPVSWKFETKKKAEGVYVFTATANVDKSWHIYSQNTGKGGPIATNFVFKTNPLIKADGKVVETGKLEKVYDKNFKTDVLFYSNSVTFTQTVTVKGKAKTNFAGTVEYMVCDDEQCLPPVKKAFDLKLQ